MCNPLRFSLMESLINRRARQFDAKSRPVTNADQIRCKAQIARGNLTLRVRTMDQIRCTDRARGND